MQPDMDTSPIVFDLETAPLLDARAYVDPPELQAEPDLSDVSAPSNWKDPVKIAAYMAEAIPKRIAEHAAENAKKLAEYEHTVTAEAALDFNLARIVALGWWVSGQRTVRLMRNQFEEREAIRDFWAVAKGRMAVGFKVREFDAPMLMQRSFYLDVPYYRHDLGRYSKGSPIIDLYDWFTFNDLRFRKVMPCTLKGVARRLGLSVTDAVGGADVPQLVAQDTPESWAAIEAHCASDVDLTVALAMRCGIVKAPPQTTGEMVRTLRERKQATSEAVGF